MRLLFNPLTITADGVTVDNNLQGALIFLDSAKKGAYTKDDIAEALRGNNMEHLAGTLQSFGDCSKSLELKDGEYKDHLINSFVGRADRQRYADSVLHHTQEPVFHQNIVRFLEGSRERIAKSDLVELNKRSVEFKDPSEFNQYDSTKEDAFQRRFNQILDDLPSYYRDTVKVDPSLTIIGTTGLLDGIMTRGMGAAANNQIRLSYRDFCEGDKQKATVILQEELLHYLDNGIGASKSPEYVRAADALLRDDSKMAAIDRQCKVAIGDKRPIRQYPEGHHKAELFVSYFLIRDHLCKPTSDKPARGWAKAEGAKESPVPADVTEKMIQLFGKELHELSVQAEETFRRNAQQIQSGDPDAGVKTLGEKHKKRDPHRPDGSAQGQQ